ncbi:MAG: AraC family transcriptional regulator [Muribaculaceae bacterium]|jgi:AraC-like DNA-binding protein|nr:AraC family transcriptional regulator [Muribaculaceae bacterium]
MINLKKINIEQVMLTGNSSFKCFHYKVGIDDAMPLHRHNEWELSWIIKGRGHHIIGDKLESAHEQELILLPPNMPHCWIFDKDKQEYTENITLQFADDLIIKLGTFKELSLIDEFFHQLKSGIEITGADAEKLKSLLMDVDKKDDFGRLITLVEILHGITFMESYREISEITDSNSKMRMEKISRIQKVYCYISNNYRHSIRLKDVAEVACISETSFCSFFKDVTRCRFSEYLCRFRIDMAANMLLNRKDFPISDICYDVGFNDVPHFNRMFRRIKGCTPSEYCRKWHYAHAE